MQYESQVYEEYTKTMIKYKKKPWLIVEDVLRVKLRLHEKVYFSLLYWLNKNKKTL